MDVKVLEGTNLEDSFNIDEVVNIKENCVAEEFLWQAGKYVRYATLLAHAKIRVQRAKLALEVIEAELDTQVRVKGVTAGTKLTESAIHNTIVALTEYQTACAFVIKAKEDEEILSGVVNALAQRKDMLMAYGSLLKAEAVAKVGLMNMPKGG